MFSDLPLHCVGAVRTFLNCTPGYSVLSCSNVSLSVSSGRATSTKFRPWSASRFARDLPMPAEASRVHQGILKYFHRLSGALLVCCMIACKLQVRLKMLRGFELWCACSALPEASSAVILAAHLSWLQSLAPTLPCSAAAGSDTCSSPHRGAQTRHIVRRKATTPPTRTRGRGY